MRPVVLILCALVAWSALASPAAAIDKPDIVEAPRAPVRIKMCSAVVPGGWRAIIWAPSDWTNADCQAFAGSLGATAYQVGCIFTEPSGPGGAKFSWARLNAAAPNAGNCGWPGATAAPVATVKLCSTLVPNAWRSITMAPPAWTGDDCKALARSIGATHVHLGCVFAGGSPKFAWPRRIVGLDTPVRNPLQAPAPDCGWLSGAVPAGNAPFMPVCSALVPNAWRSATVVLYGWTPAECQSFARSQGATFYQLGCVFAAPWDASGDRFVWGARIHIGHPLTVPPALRCGWRAA